MKLRSDFRAAVSMKNRLHHEPGEQIEEPISTENTVYGIPNVLEQELEMNSREFV